MADQDQTYPFTFYNSPGPVHGFPSVNNYYQPQSHIPTPDPLSAVQNAYSLSSIYSATPQDEVEYQSELNRTDPFSDEQEDQPQSWAATSLPHITTPFSTTCDRYTTLPPITLGTGKGKHIFSRIRASNRPTPLSLLTLPSEVERLCLLAQIRKNWASGLWMPLPEILGGESCAWRDCGKGGLGRVGGDV
jgi:hypothetical protein